MHLTETERLIIRPWQLSDIADYAALISDPAVMKYIGEGNPQTRAEAETYVKKCMTNYQNLGWSRFVVQHKKTGLFMGFCGFAHYNNELDFGWRYAAEYWGKGYGTEAARAVLTLGVKTFRFPRIVCIAYAENKASLRIIEKIEMTFEKDLTLHGKPVKQYVKLNS